MASLTESPVHVSVTVHVDPSDVYRGLDGNDDKVLTFVCQLIALTHSTDLREELLDRLGITFDAANAAIGFDPRAWQDEDYLPSEQD